MGKGDNQCPGMLRCKGGVKRKDDDSPIDVYKFRRHCAQNASDRPKKLFGGYGRRKEGDWKRKDGKVYKFVPEGQSAPSSRNGPGQGNKGLKGQIAALEEKINNLVAGAQGTIKHKAAAPAPAPAPSPAPSPAPASSPDDDDAESVDSFDDAGNGPAHSALSPATAWRSTASYMSPASPTCGARFRNQS
eukprot:COSAG05_NODE_7572_length_795_cov_1.586207_2_plen_189_part_00